MAEQAVAKGDPETRGVGCRLCGERIGGAAHRAGSAAGSGGDTKAAPEPKAATGGTMRMPRRKRFSGAALIAAMLAAILGGAGLLRQGEMRHGGAIPNVALERGRGQVLRITDGDTLTLRLKREDGGESEEKVRLIGINAPEMRSYERLPPEPFAVEARDALAELCPPGSIVEVEEHGRDKYGRLLCRLFAEGRDVGAMLLERGLARRYFLRHQNKPFEEEYGESERRAEKARIGIWSLPRKDG